jgi:hypothetical protein
LASLGSHPQVEAVKVHLFNAYAAQGFALLLPHAGTRSP